MNTFEFVRYSKNDVGVRSMFDKMAFDPSFPFVPAYSWIFILEGNMYQEYLSMAYGKHRIQSKFGYLHINVYTKC